MDNVMVNFRLPESRYAALREQAARLRVSVSSYIRNCLEAEIARGEAEVRAEESWKGALPAEVRELVGLGGTAVEDDAVRAEYHDYLAEKYS